MFGYSLNYLIDMKAAVIVDVAATPTRISKEVDAVDTMVERANERFDLDPDHLAGDVAYGTGELLGWLVKRKIDPHIPVWDKSEREDGTFSRADFRYADARDVYICPRNKTLTTTGREHYGKTLCYRASLHDCRACPLKARCCPKSPARRIPRDVNEAARDYTRALMETEAYRQSRSRRKKIERLFAEVKSHLALTRLRLRGLTGANDEFLLAATVQNLKRLIRGVGPAPPDSKLVCIA